MAGFEFLQDTSTTALEPDEILTEVRVPQPAGPSGGTYLKSRTQGRRLRDRRGGGPPSLSDGTIERAGIGLTAVGSKNLQAADAEASLAGAEPTEAAFAEAGRLAAEASSPVTDVRGSATMASATWSTCTCDGARPGARDRPRRLRNGTRARKGNDADHGQGQRRRPQCRRRASDAPRAPSGRSSGSRARTSAATPPAAAPARVLLDGRPIKSCTMPKRKSTPEGDDGRGAAPGRPAPPDPGGVQAGARPAAACTPGMMLTGTALLAENPALRGRVPPLSQRHLAAGAPVT